MNKNRTKSKTQPVRNLELSELENVQGAGYINFDMYMLSLRPAPPPPPIHEGGYYRYFGY